MKLDRMNTTTLTPSEITHILIANIIGIGILGATGPIEASGNDGWISMLIGGLYPIYIICIALIICRRFPNDNIITINKIFFGNYLGSILSMYLGIMYIYYIIQVITSFAFVTRIFIADFLPSYVIIVISMLLVFFLASKELKVLAKVNVIVFYLTFVIVLLPVYALFKGSYLNMLPIFNSGVGNIIDGGIQSMGRYSGIEIILFIYPLISDKKKTGSAAIKGVGWVIAIYVWLTFITIFYLGDDTAIKFYWPVLIIADSIQIPIINLFRYIFMLLWSLIIYRLNANLLYFSSAIFKEVIVGQKNINSKIIIGICALIATILSFFITNESIAREIGKIEPYLALAFVIYITITALLVVLFKKKLDPNE